MSRNPIRRVRAKGDAFSIGFVIGQATASSFRERVFREGVFINEQDQGLNARWRGSDYLKTLESASRTAYPGYVREIEGIAAGAGQDFETVFLWHCMTELMLPEGVCPATNNIDRCTSLLIPAEGDEPAVIAHNEDGGAQFLGACLWVEAEPDEGPAWSGFMIPGILPTYFGVNEAGIVQANNNIRPNDLKPGVPREIISRAILSAKGLDEAIEILK
ncbi:MAG: peptidase C45, partial [Mesorhizobium sp.]